MDNDAAESFAEAVDTRQHHDKGKGRGGRGRGGGGRGTGRGGGGGASREVLLSKALSKLLRHQAESAGIRLDREGFAPLDRVLLWGPIKSLSPTFAEIQSAVRDSDKQRFGLKPVADETSTDPADWLIRANQGHSIRVESEALLRPIAITSASDDGAAAAAANAVPVPETVVHGTYFAFWPAIVASGGLRRMGRNHVHCSTGLPEEGDSAVVSGMRRDAELLVYVDVERSIREAGMRWWVSENGVVLTEGTQGEEDGTEGLVPARFFKLVVGRKRDVGVLWRDGEKVADLPEGLKVAVPVGKGGRGGRGGRRGR